MTIRPYSTDRPWTTPRSESSKFYNSENLAANMEWRALQRNGSYNTHTFVSSQAVSSSFAYFLKSDSPWSIRFCQHHRNQHDNSIYRIPSFKFNLFNYTHDSPLSKTSWILGPVFSNLHHLLLIQYFSIFIIIILKLVDIEPEVDKYNADLSPSMIK